MQFERSDLVSNVEALRASPIPARRAIGDNIAFEEHVGDERRQTFEASATQASDVRRSLAHHYDRAVQGLRKEHVPETFQPINARALMARDIEPNQRIMRVERLDVALGKAESRGDALIEAMADSPPDRAIIDPVIRALNAYPGARPMFACFAAEVATDINAGDWLPRLIRRLGLGHHALAVGETGHFALMQYTVREILDQAATDAPFAIPTVFEAHGSEYFLPAPFGQNIGFAVDLEPGAGRDWIREFLHSRLTYTRDHMIKVASLTGPTPVVDLALARDAHLRRARDASGRPDYGVLMSSPEGA